MPAAVRAYLAHERVILGTLMVLLLLIAWEGLERGWWADALRPLLGDSAQRLKLKPIFISSPTLIAAAAFRMFFVTGEIWRDLAWSSAGYLLGLVLALAIGIPLGLAGGWYRRLSYAVQPFLAALGRERGEIVEHRLHRSAASVRSRPRPARRRRRRSLNQGRSAIRAGGRWP